eukprot:3515971-Alexandrium_andersonii.AAC.1
MCRTSGWGGRDRSNAEIARTPAAQVAAKKERGRPRGKHVWDEAHPPRMGRCRRGCAQARGDRARG